MSIATDEAEKMYPDDDESIAFDRWIHKIQAKAWQEGAKFGWYCGWDDVDIEPSDNPYQTKERK